MILPQTVTGMQSGMPARITYLLLGAGCIGNGLWMLVDPAGWNAGLRMQTEDFGDGEVPQHLLRKMGATYLCVSLAALWCALDKAIRNRVHPVLTLFFLLIAAVHAADILVTGAPAHRWITDFPFVFLPPLVLLAMMVPVPVRPVRLAEGVEQGTVKWFDARKGFGFIVRGNGEEIFVHYRSIQGGGHRVLKDGQPVLFRVARGDKGLQAEDVKRIGKVA
ncbi:MAG: cold shock domain-containing protein [Pseudomonadota bacterium]